VDVGGYRLHYREEGQGDVPVILESGSGGWSLHWAKVQPEVARFARVIAYDRSGTGWSDPGPPPRTSRQIAQELHQLLQNAGIEGPYVLVGHSSGGYHVRMFAHLYPKEVAGLVLVDPANEERTAEIPKDKKEEIAAGTVRQARWRSALARVGFVRLYLALATPRRMLDDNAKLPEEDRPKEFALGQLPGRLTADALESVGNLDSAEEVRAIENLGDIPLVVLTAERDGLSTPLMRERMRLHERQARLSTRGRHRTVAGSDHFIQLDRPGAVVEAIAEVLVRAQAGRP
jgi:pimeloyl-ACP methyl ester carboxylesterase